MQSICNKSTFLTQKAGDATASIAGENSRTIATYPHQKEIEKIKVEECFRSQKPDRGAGIEEPDREFLLAARSVEARTVKNILFIDARVENSDSLARGATVGTKVFVLDSTGNGVEQITRILANCSDLESLQIVSHGREAAVQLGSIELSIDNLETYSHLLQQWGKSLSERGDILLCGCNIAAGESGAAFVRRLNEIIGADIAASDNLTGSAALGGDWELGFAIGEITASIAIEPEVRSAYSYVLGTLVNETFKNATVKGPWIYRGTDGVLYDPLSGIPASLQLIPGITGGTVSGLIPALGGDIPGNGVLRLTPASPDRREAFVLYNNPIPSTDGLVVRFDIYSYGANLIINEPRGESTGNQPGDGIGFFFIDGTASPEKPGGYGGSLGYAQRLDGTVATPGIEGGYLGIGLDEFGNFSAPTEGRSGPDPAPIPGSSTPRLVRPDSVTLRGREGNGYPFLTQAFAPFGVDNIPTPIDFTEPGFNFSNTFTTNRAAAKRSVQVTLNPSNVRDNPNRLTVAFDTDFNGSYETTLIDIANLATANGAPVPPSFKFGFGSSTGSANNLHELQNLVVETVNPPTIFADVVTIKSGPQSVKPGGSITYTITTTNRGTAPAGQVVVQDQIPQELIPLIPTLPTVIASNGGTYLNATRNVTWPAIPVLNVGQSVTYTLTVALPPPNLVSGATLTNVASSSSATFDPDLTNNDGSSPASQVLTTVTDRVADLVTTKSGPIVSTVGSTVTYNLVTTNNGPDAATNVTISDSIIPGLIGVTASEGGTYNPTTGIVTFPELPTLANAGTTARTVSFVTPVTLDTISNTARSSSATSDPIATNNNGSPTNKDGSPTNSSVTTTLNPSADVVTIKSGPTATNAGVTVSYTIATVNNGPSSASNVTITDSIIPGLIGVTASEGGTYNSTTGIVTFAPVTIANATTVTRTIGFIAPASISAVSNTARSTSATTDPTPGNNNGTNPNATVNTTIGTLADVVTTKTGPTATTAGAAVSYTIATVNNGPSSASNVTIADSIIPGLTGVTASDGGTYNSTTGIVTFTPVTIANGITVNRTIGFIAPVTLTAVRNTARSSSTTPDPTPGNNDGTNPNSSVSTTINSLPGAADIATTKTGPTATTAGATVSYTIATVNNGPSSASNVTITDSIILGLTEVIASDGGIYNPTTGIVTFTPVTIANGTTVTRTIGFIAPASISAVSNTARSSSATPDPTPGNNNGTNPNSSVNTTIGTVPSLASADLSTIKSGPTATTAGATVTYTIATVNNGPSPAEAATITDSIIPGLTGVTASDGGIYNPTTGIITFGPVAIANGTTVTRTIGFIAPASISAVRNTARSTSATPDPTPGNNDGTNPNASVNTTIGTVPSLASADLSTIKSGLTSAAPGQSVTYTITTANIGSIDAANVTITDSIIPGLTGVVASNGGSYDPISGLVIFPAIASVPVGQTVTSTVTLGVPSAGSITNISSSKSTTPDLNPSNNDGSSPSARVTTTVRAGTIDGADLVTTKTGLTSTTAGSAVTYTINTANDGPATAENVAIADRIIPGLTGVVASDNGSYDPVTGIVTFPTISRLASGSNVNRQVTLIVPAIGITNTSQSRSTTPDPNNNNNNGSQPNATVTTTVKQTPVEPPTPTPPPTPPVNQPPVANDSGVILLPDKNAPVPGLGGTDPDGIITFFTINSLLPPEEGTLFLGDPAKGGVPVTPNQVLTPDQISQLFFQSTSSFTGSQFTYSATDNLGKTSLGFATVTGSLPTPTPTPTPTLTPTPTPTQTPIFGRVPEPDTGCGCTPLPLLPSIAFPQPQREQKLNFNSNASALINIQDTIIGTPGNDYLIGNDANELFVSEPGDDTVLGEGGTDIIFGDQQRDFIAAGRGNDIVYAGKQNDVVFGGKQDDRIFGDRGSDTLYGDRGSDTIVGDNGNNIELTGDNSDLIFGGEAGDAIAGNQGRDTVYSGKGPDIAYGGKESDLIFGDKGNDSLYGDNGDDSLFGGVLNSQDGDLDGRDLLFGGNGNDLLNGQQGDDTLLGGNGRDLVFGGKGGDQIFGETDRDTLYGGRGSDTILGDYGNPLGSTITTDEADLIFGNDAGDVIGGGSGNDSIFAGKGNDLAYGGKDNDLILGELGSDTLVGDEGDDSLYGGLQNQLISDANGRDLLFGGDGNDLLNGGESSDSLSGDNGNDTIHGGKDDDLAHGGADNDLIYGDDGSDILCGDEGNDTIFGDRGENELGPVGAIGQQDCINGGSGDDLLYGNEGQDTLNGDDGNDTLYGGKDSDILNGGAGDDWLFGDGGQDTLIGGIGNDRFVLNSNSGIDTILNFEVGTDKFVLAGGLSFDALQINSTTNGYVLQVATTGEVLANIFGVNNPITALDFVTLPR